MPIAGFDHVALPAGRPEELLRFYAALGFEVPTLDAWRAARNQVLAVHFGPNKINFHHPDHWRDPTFVLRGPTAQPGCGDLCFVWSGTQDELLGALKAAGAPVEVGPVDRVGGRKVTGSSIYTRDPDGNLLEFIIYG